MIVITCLSPPPTRSMIRRPSRLQVRFHLHHHCYTSLVRGTIAILLLCHRRILLLGLFNHYRILIVVTIQSSKSAYASVPSSSPNARSMWVFRLRRRVSPDFFLPCFHLSYVSMRGKILEHFCSKSPYSRRE